ncbi:MAG: hypothetical protein ABIR35_04710 [Polaromonas sp.]
MVVIFVALAACFDVLFVRPPTRTSRFIGPTVQTLTTKATALTLALVIVFMALAAGLHMLLMRSAAAAA